MILKKLSPKLKIGKINCFIPCRKKGDKIDNLNFLELEGKKLVEYSIIVALESKLFDKIFIISDDKLIAKKLITIYPKLNFIYEKKMHKTFDKLVANLKNKEKILTDTICVLLPNFPFKTIKSLRKMYDDYTKNNLSLIMSSVNQNRSFYKQNKTSIDKLKYFDSNKISKLFNITGGIFFYSKKRLIINFEKLNINQLFILNEHEAFGIYSLYDFIKASSLFNIDKSIIDKLLGYKVKI